MAIHPYTNETETRWGRGDFGAMIRSPRSDKPLAYADGTAQDEAELVEQAELEGLTSVLVEKKHLKTGREVWTITGESEQHEGSDED